MDIPESCKGCGKCCIWESLKDVPKHEFCKNCDRPIKTPYLIYGRCQHLDKNNECSIYRDTRPNGCILLVRGGEDCIIFLNEGN